MTTNNNTQAQNIYLILEQEQEQERERAFLEQQQNKQFLAEQLKKDLKDLGNCEIATATINPTTLRIETDSDSNQNNRKITLFTH